MKQNKFLRGIAVYLALSLLFEIAYPTVAMALTGGPSQPETSSFEPVGTSDMVDLFSGDFNYNIPLLDVGGYPVNISYHSGISMDQEASWVGLGWNVNAGAINRSMRGLPDDFKGEEVVKNFNVKPNCTYGANVGFGAAVAGFDKLKLNFSIGAKYNNYTGVGFEQSANIAISSGSGGKGPLTGSLGLKSSADGLDISPSVSYSAQLNKKDGIDTKLTSSIGSSFNSRAGLKALTINTSVSQSQDVFTKTVTNVDGNEVVKMSKADGSIGAVGTGCSMSFTNNTYVPSITMPMKNLAVNANFQMGATMFSIDGTLNVSGYYAEQKLSETTQRIPAYGYMYSEDAANLDKVLMDFNREKDGSFTKTTPNLPLTNFSYDLYSVSGQGVGGMFRPFRGDIGYVFDSRNSSTSDSYSLGLEIAVGNLAHSGFDFTINDVNTTSGKWTENNKAADRLKFRKTVSGNARYEPFFFKEVGEKNVDANPEFYTRIGGSEPVRIGLQDDGGYEIRAKPTFEVGTSPVASGDIEIPKENFRTVRQKRNQLLSFVNRKDYSASALEVNLKDSINSNAKPDHIAEITTTKTDGTRYVYGLPAYNTKQLEVTFSMGSTGSNADGTINYTPFDDNSKKNSQGIDNYFTSTELPAFAHSYLLTAVLSADYVDLTGNGCSPDDYGTYTKFTYMNPLKFGNNNHMYNWRTPYKENVANFNEGLITGQKDNQGNYVYGEKEIWMLAKIETKNYVAVFVKKQRRDGFDVAGENGGIGDNTTPLLKKISLYSRPDYEANKTNLNLATPLKEVHFEYDYSLCPGVFNNQSVGTPKGTIWTRDAECEAATDLTGKLTLKHIYFTYGKSLKAKLNPYTFNYSTANKGYGPKNYDKWGNYKLDLDPNGANSAIENAYFPYVEQGSQAKADENASAWSLSKIELPSGGVINVNYESDDYAYVQDRRAMQMFMITGIGTSSTDSPTAQNDLSTNDDPNKADFLFFKLQNPVPGNTPNSQFYEDYAASINYMYFKCMVDINNNGSEYIPGYADGIKKYGYATQGKDANGNYQYGYIQVNSVKLEDNRGPNVNPISKAAIQFTRIYTPKQAYNNFPDPDPSKVTMESVIRGLADAGFLKNIIQTFEGPNNTLFNNPFSPQYYYGHTLTYGKSWIRLLNPNRKKLGGGARVNKITISDEWGAMVNSASQTYSYGQEYAYTKQENGKTISSGVASYEPLIGGDENPFRLPVTFGQKFLMAPDFDFFQEEPFGESFFPSPSIGYSTVTVKNLTRASIKRHATGYVVNEFYTARDFPVITSRTPVDPKPKKSDPLFKLLTLKVTDNMTASQGFSIELNDMHGKPKATKVYAEGQTEFISGVEYKYKAVGNKLDNTAVVINKNGSIQNTQIGVDYDFVTDMREQRSDVLNAGLQVNLYGFLVAIVPIVIPPILPTLSSEQTRFRSATTTKVINRFALLDETIAYDLGSVVSTKNLSYDAETGEVVLTKTKNDFNDEIYNYNYPAHLAYDRMGPGYKNVGVILSSANGLVFNASGKITDPTNTLVPGDEIQLTGTLPANKTRFWIKKEKNTNDLYAIDAQGIKVPFTGSYTLRVVRSGRRNQQSMSVGSFTSLLNPINKTNAANNDSQLGTFDESYNILNASATKYSEVWRTFCVCGNDPNVEGNPYIKGTLGNWRTKRGYAFLSDRNQTKFNDNSNIRKDGTYSFFRPFWLPNGILEWTAPTDLATANPNWTWSTEITEHSPYGPELENRDALNRYSSAIYGYNNTLPLAVGANAMYKQIGNDNFEDYDFDDCPQDHFSFEQYLNQAGNNVVVSSAEAHSGKRSIKVPPGKNVEIIKTIDPCVVSGAGRD